MRDYLNGSTVNTGNHWTEIEVWGTTTAYVGDYYEWNGSLQTMTRYYYADGQRVAVRNGNGSGTNGLVYLLGDHLGSASLTADTLDGDKLSELRYKAWGETRYALTSLPTDRRFTGQVEEAGIGLSYFNARWYDPALSRFASTDTDVPESQGVQAWDRYAFVNNNPLKYVDPTGHRAEGASTISWAPPPPRKPTPRPRPSQPSLQDIFKDRRTQTPQRPGISQGQTSTATPQIPVTPYNPSLHIDVQVDWSNVDWIDAGIDAVGLATNAANIMSIPAGVPEVGIIVDVVGDAVEIGGLIKAGYDMSKGDLQNLKLQLATDSAKQAALASKLVRAVPYIGFVGNAVSLWLNFRPNITIDFR